MGGFNSSITLSASGMPAGTTLSFNPETIPAPGARQLDSYHYRGSEHAVGHLSDYRDRQRRWYAAHRYVDPDGHFDGVAAGV